jgi:hypothetical protein
MLILTRKATKEMERPSCHQTNISHDGQHGIGAWDAEGKGKLVLHHKKTDAPKGYHPLRVTLQKEETSKRIGRKIL